MDLPWEKSSSRRLILNYLGFVSLWYVLVRTKYTARRSRYACLNFCSYTFCELARGSPEVHSFFHASKHPFCPSLVKGDCGSIDPVYWLGPSIFVKFSIATCEIVLEIHFGKIENLAIKIVTAMASKKPIFCVTHPRACSTAFERVCHKMHAWVWTNYWPRKVFMTREDLACVHEPFGDAFYYG